MLVPNWNAAETIRNSIRVFNSIRIRSTLLQASGSILVQNVHGLGGHLRMIVVPAE